jgi:cob(I)alamin adenosyltransferase
MEGRRDGLEPGARRPAMKIYTRTGDQGTTGLFGGERVSKDNKRLIAYGTLDELNSVLGVLMLNLAPELEAHTSLQMVQRDLFALGAVLATPPAGPGSWNSA